MPALVCGWLRERKDPRGKYARWILEFEALNYKIISRNGLDHVVPDCLSRASGNMNDKEIQDEEQFFDNHIFMLTGDFQGKDSKDVGSSPKEVLDLEKLKSEQALDDAIVFAITQLKENNEIRKGRYKRFNRVHLKDDMLMRGEQIIVPTSMRFEIVDRVHRSMGHQGAERTREIISRKYLWVGMQGYIEDFCAHCKICQVNKSSRAPKAPLSEFADPPSKPREQVAFDIATLPWASNNYRYFLLIIDMYSRYIEIAPMKDREAPTIKAALLQHWIYRHGKFQTALSDQARNVDESTVRKLCEQLNIEKKHSSSYHPEGDGMAERAIGTVKTTIRCVLQEENVSKYRWPDVLQQVAFLFSASKCSSTGLTPYEVMYGEKPVLPLTIMQSSTEGTTTIKEKEYVEELKAKLEDTWEKVGERIVTEKEKRAKFYNAGKRTKNAVEGDFVYVKNQRRCSSLDPLYLGPYKVIWRREHNVKILVGDSKTQVVHLNNCKVMPKTEIVTVPVDISQPPANEPNIDLEGTYVEAEDVPPIQENNLPAAEPQTMPEELVQDLDVPIAHRRSHRNKAYYRYGEDFVKK